MKEKDDIALIGCGHWGSILSRYIPEHFNLKYIANSKFNKEVIWKDQNVHSVIIATPIETHYQIAKDALSYDKNLLCEKPFTLNEQEAIELKKIAKERGLLVLVDFTHTFSKALQRARILAENETVGRICSIELFLKKYVKFHEHDVYWLLASHLLSILDLFVPLNQLAYERVDSSTPRKGTLLFKNEQLSGKAVVSLNSRLRETKVIVKGDKGRLVYDSNSQYPLTIFLEDGTIARKYSFNEKDNLRYVIEAFHKMLHGFEKSNVDRAILVTKVLENLEGNKWLTMH